jgi:RNA polymerase subunit RPABC4/transcription elongation factor Spt4
LAIRWFIMNTAYGQVGEIMTQNPYSPSSSPPDASELLLRINNAMLQLGYAPRRMLWDAALRMARSPDLASDMIAYVDAGMPPQDMTARTPVMLFRSLPGNYTVASLIRDFGFRPVGAFLLATDLVHDPQKTLALLKTFIEHGYWVMSPDGKHELRYPPVSGSFSRCPECDAVLFTNDPVCPECGTKIFAPPQPEVALSLQKRCPACDSPLQSGMKFCGECGAPVLAPAPQQAPPKTVCTGCGQPVQPDKKFCGNCGAPVGAASQSPLQ